MAMCISRRAESDRNTFRLINEKGEIGKHIWTEFRCPNVVSDGSEICKSCSYKLPKYKYQANQKCDHGLVGGPYTADSKLYGSAYYLNEIKNGWKILDQDELRAKAAVAKATSNMAPRKKVQAVEAVQEEVKLEVKPEAKPDVKPDVKLEVKPKRKYVRKNPSEVKLKKKDEIELPIVPPVIESHHEPKFIESIAPPITITDCVVVKVKKTKIQGKDYYYDSVSGKLYGISVNGVGAYKGRYKEEEDLVDTAFPDSDCE